MEGPSFKLEQFEGPLDLLLHFITKHKMNIFDIEISSLLEQYMKYIEAARDMDMQFAGEFLEMASRLVHIKTVSLLPKHEEGDALKKELTGELIEYSLCKSAARLLGERFCGNDIFCRSMTELETDKTYNGRHTAKELLAAVEGISGRAKTNPMPDRASFAPIVSHKIVSVASRIIFVLKKLYKKTRIKFFDFFENSKSRSESVATFMAILELVKAGRLKVDDGEVTMNRNGGRTSDDRRDGIRG